MKATRILASLILLAATAGAANAQFVRCSWGTCDPQVFNRDYTPGTPPLNNIYQLVVSAIGADAPNIGNDVSVFIYPDVPDAWRFDDLGCQTGSQLLLSTNAFNKTTCPTLRGLNPGNNTIYGYDPGSHRAQLRMVVTHDGIDPLPGTRYTLWVVGFDHSFSKAGPSDPVQGLCGGAEQPLALELRQVEYLRLDGGKDILATGPGDVNPCTWNGGPVSTERSTLGRVKAQYR